MLLYVLMFAGVLNQVVLPVGAALLRSILTTEMAALARALGVWWL